MAFDHEKLDVYKESLVFYAQALKALGDLPPRGQGHIDDQLRRAALSIVLNIAEGTAKFSKPDKRRYYLSARGSAAECSALMDVMMMMKLLDPGVGGESKEVLNRIGAMLTKLSQSMEKG